MKGFGINVIEYKFFFTPLLKLMIDASLQFNLIQWSLWTTNLWFELQSPPDQLHFLTILVLLHYGEAERELRHL